jgi:glycosyltransferase involved in cell wall biosynthesis
MKIALIGPTYPFRGGISHYTTLLNSHLQKKHQVQFYTFSRPYPKLLYPGNASPDQSTMRFSNKNTISIIDWANPFSWIKTGLLIIRWSPQIIIFPWWMWGWAIPFWVIAKIASLRNKVKTLFICHNVIEHEAAFWKSVLTKFALSVGDFYIVHSHEDYKNLRKIFPDAKVIINFHPTYEIFNQESISKEEAKIKLRLNSKFKKTILFFGVVRPYKGLSYFIEAMPKIIAEIPDLCLIIAGEFWAKEDRYLKQIRELHIEDEVKVINKYVPNEEVGIYFSAADVVVLPYVSGTGSGIVQIAYGFDKPVIATKVGCLPEVVDHERTGYLVEPMNSQAIADAIVSFYKEGKEEAFVNNITKEKEKFSWDKMVETLESFQ